MAGEQFKNNFEEESYNPSDYNDFSNQDLNDYKQANHQNNKEKINSIIILMVGFFAVIFGVFSFWFTVSNPFASIINESQKINQELMAKEQARMESLKALDTDGDGLTDYEELYVYGTSPYLKDTDGDGISDYDEIFVYGTDPNCPTGSVCSGIPNVLPDPSGSGIMGISDNNPLNTVISVPSLQTKPQGLSITPDYIRSVMRQNGATEEELSELTDEVIIAEFRDYLKDNEEATKYFENIGMDVNSFINPGGIVGLDSLNDISSADDLKNLSGAQIRQLMLQSGASESILNSVNDEQLKKMFLDRLSQEF